MTNPARKNDFSSTLSLMEAESRRPRARQLTPEELAQDVLRGVVSRLFTANPTFSAGKLDSQDRVNAVSFTAPVMLVEGSRVVLSGKWVSDPKFGPQFKARSVEYDMSLDKHGLALWLRKNIALKGIGPARAMRIAETFGDDFDQVITETPERIHTECKVPMESVKLLQGLWVDYRDHYKLITWLAGFGLSIHEIEKIKEKYGNEAIGILQADPYLIIGEVERFQFKKVDQIALKIGIKKDHDGRITHGILWCVKDALNGEGSTYIELDELIDKANRILELDRLDSKEIIRQKIDELVTEGKLDAVGTEEAPC